MNRIVLFVFFLVTLKGNFIEKKSFPSKKIFANDNKFIKIKLSTNQTKIIMLNYKSDIKYKNFVLNGIEKIIGTTTFNYIDSLSIDYKQQIDIKNYGLTKFLEVTIYGDLPSSTPRDYHVLFNNVRSEILVAPLTKIYFVKSSVKESKYFLGGLTIRKNIGVFNIYSFNKGEFTKSFKSEDAPIVFLNSKDCIRIKNNYLSFKNKDVNEDGYLDIIFSGIIQTYCAPNEFGVNLSGRKPIKSKRINYVSKYNPSTFLWLPPKRISILQKLK